MRPERPADSALGLGANAPPLPWPRSEGAQERLRTRLRRTWLPFARHTLSRAHSGRDLGARPSACRVPRAALAKARPAGLRWQALARHRFSQAGGRAGDAEYSTPRESAAAFAGRTAGWGQRAPLTPRKRCCFRRPNSVLWTNITLNPAKAVPPMQACAVHLCHRSPRRCRACLAPMAMAAPSPSAPRARSVLECGGKL